MVKILNTALAALAIGGLAMSAPAYGQYKQKISNDMSKCRGSGPAVKVTVTGVKSGSGTMRVQLYRATKSEWLEKGRWLNRIETPARAGTMTFCLPAPSAGTYGVAVRHDLNGDRKTDIFSDGGAISNNPSINILNLGKPNYKKAAFAVGNTVESINVRMRYR
ncbi:DUF2141 domain-containing protein [Altererythrobacter aquiaggeris]|uniref:DUF2141 domain-containing protein n=1 Tax=Aestuarierythrobacter aquiaggeris TaxID=1898396 RepID=UPI0030194028